jgi:hypothetical protein
MSMIDDESGTSRVAYCFCSRAVPRVSVQCGRTGLKRTLKWSKFAAACTEGSTTPGFRQVFEDIHMP